MFEVRRPGDWEALVRRYPAAWRRRPNTSWELPGVNQRGVEPLLAVPGQRAAVASLRYFVEPDWNAVAEDYDGVHLTWSGFLTCEGLVIPLDDGDIAMLRGWGSERTLWLNRVLSDPEPLPAAAASGRMAHAVGVDLRADERRRAQDLRWLGYLLGEE